MSLLALHQRRAESRMIDTVLIESSAGKVMNPANGKLEESWAEVYAGKGNWLSPTESARVDVAGTEVQVDTQVLCLPVQESVSVRAGMRVTTVTCPNDPARVGRHATITRDMTQSHPVRRRLVCKEA